MTDAYRRYFEAMPCFLTVQDRDFRLLDANARFRRHFGQIEGRTCYQAYKQRPEKCEVCPVEKAFWDGRPHRSEELIRTQDGREMSVLVDAMPVRDDDGQIIAVMEMSTDVTQIRRLQGQLQESQSRYRQLFEEVPCYISIQDEDLRIVDANRAFREAFGHGLGCKCYEVYKHRDEECWPCTVRQAFGDGLPHTHEEVVTSLEGERFNVLVSSAPIRDQSGKIAAVMEMSANITMVRQLQSQLQSLGMLIGSISHGLKGLLSGLGGGVYLAESGLKKDKMERVRRGFEMIRRNADRIRSMVGDILYYAKDRTPAWEEVVAATVAEEVRQLVAARAQEQGVEFSLDVSADVGAFEADRQAVRALLVNLVENALDACRLDEDKDSHHVFLTASGEPDAVRFVIIDDGIGMDRETKEKAFSLFYSSKGMAGTGLGLFIAHKIARAHGGGIELESEPGVGSAFTVSLSRERPEQPPEEDEEQRAATAEQLLHG